MWAYVVLHFKLCVHPCSAFYPLPLLMHVEERMFANQWAADHRLKALREEAECAAAQERNVEQIKVRLVSQSTVVNIEIRWDDRRRRSYCFKRVHAL